MAKLGFGATFQLSSIVIVGSAGMLAEVTRVGLPNFSQETVEATHHGSTGGQREFIPGLVELDEFEVEMQLMPGSSATDVICETAASSRAIYYCKAAVPKFDTGLWSYTGQGIVTGYNKSDAEIDGKMTATLTIKPTGAWTRA